MTADSDSLPSYPRLTKSVRQQILDLNEGLSFQTYFSSPNSSESSTYTVENGTFLVRRHGKGAFGGSQYDETRTASEEDAHAILYDHRDKFDYSGVDPKLPPVESLTEEIIPESISDEEVAPDLSPEEEAALEQIPDEVIEDLRGEPNPEAQSRIAMWFEDLTPNQRLIVGATVISAFVGGVVVYKFRKPIADRTRRVVDAARKKFSREPAEEEE